MGDETCNCCNGQEMTTDAETTTTTETFRWLAERPVMQATLPRELQEAAGNFFGTEPVDTLATLAARMRDQFDGPIETEQLCHSDQKTDHVGVLDGDTHYFQCFYDAVILAAVVEAEVEIQTESPGGAAIEATAAGSEIGDVTPSSAVVSFGIAETDSSTAPTLQDGYEAICPYVKAFPDRTSYEQWAKETTAPTVGMPFETATALPEALIK